MKLMRLGRGRFKGVGEAVDFDEAELKDRLIALRAIYNYDSEAMLFSVARRPI